MTAGSLSTLFAWAALICTLAGAVSTGVSLHYRSISSKEKDLEIASIGLEAANSNAEAAKAHERIAVLSTQAEQLRKASAEAQADIAKARANIASAAARNKEAELKLEQLRKAVGPRSLSAKFNEDLKDKPGCNVLISYVADAGDTWALATMIYYMLPRGNGWSVEHARAITEQDRTAALARLRLPEGAPIPRGMDIHFSATGAVRGLPTGVTIMKSVIPAAFRNWKNCRPLRMASSPTSS
jgi:hypothetical protein